MNPGQKPCVIIISERLTRLPRSRKFEHEPESADKNTGTKDMTNPKRTEQLLKRSKTEPTENERLSRILYTSGLLEIQKRCQCRGPIHLQRNCPISSCSHPEIKTRKGEMSNFSSDFNCRPASKLFACILRNLADQKVGFRKLGDGRLFRLRDNVRAVLRRKLQSKTAVAGLKTHVPFIGASMKR